MKIIKKIKANICTFEDFSLLIQIFFMVMVLPFMVKRLSVSKLMHVFTPERRKICTEKKIQDYEDKIVKFTDYILNLKLHLWEGTCLKRSLVIYHLLQKIGKDVHICFGTRYNKNLAEKEAKKHLEGHAWLVYKGNIFLEKNIALTRTYTMTYIYPNHYE